METKYHFNGVIKSIKHMVNYRYHRDNGPANQRWNEAGILILEEWYQHGFRHRNNSPNHFAERNDPNHFAERNGPARQEWNNAGQLIAESWRQNGIWHRDDGPAYQQWNDAGVLIRDSWLQNNPAGN
jgi:YD repeat-containing protein